jgi:hypothetical protein
MLGESSIQWLLSVMILPGTNNHDATSGRLPRSSYDDDPIESVSS